MNINQLLTNYPELILWINGQWITLFIFTLFASGGAFFGAYLKKQGENIAIKENFDAIREQLKVTTRDTEEIKHHLSGTAWLTQQQWSAREMYYSKILTHLNNYCLAIDGLAEYYIEPHSEYKSDSQQGEHFHQLIAESKNAFDEVLKLQGPSALYLSQNAIKCLNELAAKHYSLINYEVSSTAEYVSYAQSLGTSTYELILSEAKKDLNITS